MAEFTHYIITRVNLSKGFGHADATQSEWLERRLQLFDTFCYPSVRSQSNQNFRWLVLFDAETPVRFHARIAEYAKWDRFVPCFVEAYAMDAFGGLIADVYSEQTDYLITSRLDSDDAISYDFVDNIQKQFQGQEFRFINFVNGLRFEESRKRLYAMRHRSNMFLSLIEKIDSVERVKTVMMEMHQKVHEKYPVMQIDIQPQWLSVIHDQNMTSQLGLHRRVKVDSVATRFGVNLDLPEERTLEVVAMNIFYWLRRLVSKMRQRVIRYYNSTQNRLSAK